ncbi:low temperature requirement protein A [Fertoebacter nigrum]|uniref:Low temperature requirement protein A n=1 Tax=Fertoeibacter niger TaxID=2656921 RepID=A0A8X8GXD3_9RHOB|nr:low temperature requirement protein A [Fertoeibacter niger]NUB42910.1 low temperature requirement protein A [Fertoeibacter niger]
MPVIPARLTSRDPHEHHRVATTLELFVDLASVIAIASAAAGLHHAISADHAFEGVVTFVLAFFGIWWAWMNYTWFASAYDDGSLHFRLATFVFISGALVMAGGIEAFFAAHDLTLAVLGYVIMRLAMIWLWLAAAAGDPGHRATASRYAGGIALVQLYWVALLFLLPPGFGPAFVALFVLGGVLELAVPFVSEKSGMTPWHRHHIIERYGLLNIIVLGEALLAIALAVRAAADAEAFDIRLVHLCLAALCVTFSMWWLYFTDDEHLTDRSHAHAFAWGYGHILIFGAGAAAGAGFAVLVDVLTDHAKVGLFAGDVAVAVPLALYLAGLWIVRDRLLLTGARRALLPVAGALLLVTPFLPVALEAMAAIMLLTAALRGRRAA